MRCAIALALGLAVSSPALHAAGLGRLNVQSALGQPLRAEVEVTSVSRDEASTLAVRLASQSAFRQANLDFNPALTALRFSLEQRGDTSYVIHITSMQPVSEPYLDLLLELTWATGRVLREYTVLLDPPSLRAAAEVVPPSASVRVPAPVVGPPAAAPAPAAPAAAAAAPASTARAAAPSGAEGYTVKPGDTLGRIAQQNKAPTVSLDQMLVALFRTNPNAFVGDNMNRLLAGRTLMIPSAADAEAISAADARREVIAQSRDFSRFRSRLAQVATGAPAAPALARPPAAAAQGQITAKVEDRAAPAKAGDQLKIAKAEASAAGAAAAAKARDEEVARQRALKDQEERAAALKKTNEALAKALELQSKAGAQAQAAAKAASAPAPQAAAPAPAPATLTPSAPPPPAAAAAEPVKSESPAPAPAPAPPAPQADAPKRAPAPPPPPPEPTLVEQLTSPYVLGGAGTALIALLVGLNLYRRRKVETGDEFKATGEGLRANSLFGSTGGQSVDTGATSTFNSSFIPAASQLDSGEVDPVAEADVYIAYGREEQAEDILKEALRVQPDRHGARVKLLEIYSRRGDKASFAAMMAELRNRTGGSGDDWDRAAKLGRAFDPGNPLYGNVGAESGLRGPTSELRLNPATAGGGGAAPMSGAAAAALSAASQPRGRDAAAPMDFGLDSNIRASSVESLLTPETGLRADSRTTADSRVGGAAFQRTESPRFEATFAPVPAAPEPVTGSAIDFSSLDFDLGPANAAAAGNAASAPAARPSSFDLRLDTPAPSPVSAPARPAPAIPDLSLDIPERSNAPAPSAFSAIAALAPTSAAPAQQGAADESMSRPTLLGDVGPLTGPAPRLATNTDQATVPLIDFDLSGSDVELGGRRTETQAGSPLANQMATKLDLARGYIDLGVKDGARELLEEVMRDGTREQRQSAVELLKQVEA